MELRYKGSTVSRRDKLVAALQSFNLPVEGRICADVGASTGGFTDCLLQHGAGRVYAIDVGRGILDWSLRQHPKVVVMEGTNARYVERLPEPVSLITVDASFISLKILLPVVKNWFQGGTEAADEVPVYLQEHAGDVIALIKPQFEAGKEEARRGKGVIRNPGVHARVLTEILSFAKSTGYSLRGLLRSPLEGPKGNLEFLSWLSWPAGVSAILIALIAGVNQAEPLHKEENGEQTEGATGR
jgi:23S rRNA (cytidine1920-2'-O)/16S rRNA (cytidine1409-2'-O)-methyltransferase